MKFDVIVIGGGLAGMAAATALLCEGMRVAVVSRGRSLWSPDYSPFISKGGHLLMGDEVTGADLDGTKVRSVTTHRLGKIEAENYILASGKYFSGGIVTDMERIFEPIFGCDIASTERAGWFSDHFSDDHPFMHFGVIIDEDCHPTSEGRPFDNLYAAGEILEGINGADPSASESIRRSAMKVVDIIAKR